MVKLLAFFESALVGVSVYWVLAALAALAALSALSALAAAVAA